MTHIFTTIRDVLLSIGFAILLPIAVYQGVTLLRPMPEYPSHKPDDTQEIRDQKYKAYQEAKKPFETTLFYSALAVGLFAIILGSLVAINSLSLGLIGGGVTTIFLGLMNSPYNYFVFVLLLLAVLALLMIYTQKKSYSHEKK